ncbi:hypothetical protein GCM10027275_06730 [Rhabdobacter roseus]
MGEGNWLRASLVCPVFYDENNMNYEKKVKKRLGASAIGGFVRYNTNRNPTFLHFAIHASKKFVSLPL